MVHDKVGLMKYSAPLPKDAPYAEVKNWCEEQFGPVNYNYQTDRWAPLEWIIHFRYEKDCTWYLLRWG